MASKKNGIDGVHIVPKVLAGGTKRWFIYAWRGGPCIRKVDSPARPSLTVDDARAIAEAFDEVNPKNQDTMRGLVAAYRGNDNPDWTRLAESTRRLWSDCLDAIIVRFGDTPLRFWNSPAMIRDVMKWRAEMAGTPRKADNHIATLSRLLNFGRLNARVSVNIADGIPSLYRGGGRAAIIWTDDDFTVFFRHAKTPVADAVRLASMTGLRRSDLVALKWSEVGEWAIQRTTLKKSAGKRRKAVMPIIPGLKALLDELKTRPRKPGVNTVLVTGFGDAWTPTGLNSSFHETRGKCVDDQDRPLLAYTDEEGNEKWKRLHDIRGTFATKLMTIPGARLTDKEIAELMSWSEQQVAEIRRTYVDDAAIVVALGKRLANTDVNQTVNRRGQ